jgi:hypothetical protein
LVLVALIGSPKSDFILCPPPPAKLKRVFLLSPSQTVGFTVDASPTGRPAGVDAGHAQAAGAAPPRRDFSEVDLTLSKDHWDPLSDARWSQAADTVSFCENDPIRAFAFPRMPQIIPSMRMC